MNANATSSRQNLIFVLFCFLNNWPFPRCLTRCLLVWRIFHFPPFFYFTKGKTWGSGLRGDYANNLFFPSSACEKIVISLRKENTHTWHTSEECISVSSSSDRRIFRRQILGNGFDSCTFCSLLSSKRLAVCEGQVFPAAMSTARSAQPFDRKLYIFHREMPLINCVRGCSCIT